MSSKTVVPSSKPSEGDGAAVVPAKAPQFGPNNPHPLSALKTELVWEGKYDEWGNRREVDFAGASMPLQRIETIDEPRSRAQAQGDLFDVQKAHLDDFRNMLIWGDNKLVAASLLKDFKGKIDLIYIDPPFDVGADFTMDVPIGDGKETTDKDQSTLEMVAYRDMWGRGTDSYLHMLSERLTLMRELLSNTGSIYIHVGPNVSHYVRSVADEIFGPSHFINEIVWRRAFGHSDSTRYGIIHDALLFYSKGDQRTWNVILQPPDKEYVETFFDQYDEGRGEKYQRLSLSAGGLSGGGYDYEYKGVRTLWRCPIETLRKYDAEGRLHWPKKKGGVPRLKRYESEYEGVPLQDIWTDISKIHNQSSELAGYATQKPEALLERVIKVSSNEGDLVADFFCGSGTTGTVAERLGRRWIMADLGRFAIHTSRKRLIELQRTMHDAGTQYRAFDVYNLGRYERQWWQKERLKGADEGHRQVVLEFYKAEILTKAPSPLLHGRKGTALCHVDGIDGVFTREEVKAVARAAKAAGAKELVCLAWEFEMDLRLTCSSLEHELDIKIKLVQIPREIMEKNRKEPPPFLEVATLKAEAVVKTVDGKRVVDIKLVNFIPSLAEVPTNELQALQERAVKSGFDFIDFWAVDFDFKNGGPFNHHWQDYRTRKDRSLKTVSDQNFVYPQKGHYTACVKVVDIFGCDTSATVEVNYD
ncbi:MAG: site-specific DNA-methyltransferase [Bryobacteraceae bacterium]